MRAPQPHAPAAGGRVTRQPDCFGSLGFCLDLRHDDPVRPEIQHSLDATLREFLQPDDARHIAIDSLQDGRQRRGADGTMLGVDEQPVEPGCSKNLGN